MAELVVGRVVDGTAFAMHEVNQSFLILARHWRNRLNGFPDYCNYRQAFGRLTPEERKSLENRLADAQLVTSNTKMSRGEAAQMIGRSAKTAAKVLKGTPFAWRGHYKLFTREAVLEAFYLYGRTAKTNVYHRKPGPPKRLDAEALLELVVLAQCGIKFDDLAWHYRISKSTVYEVICKATANARYVPGLSLDERVRNAFAVYASPASQLNAGANQLLEEEVIVPFLARGAGKARFGPYVRLLDAIRPGTAEHLRESLSDIAQQEVVAATLQWLRQTVFDGDADLVEYARRYVDDRVSNAYETFVPAKVRSLIGAGLSVLEHLTSESSSLKVPLGFFVRKYFFEGMTAEQIGEQLSVTRSRVGQKVAEGVGQLRSYIDKALGYGGLEASIASYVRYHQAAKLNEA